MRRLLSTFRAKRQRTNIQEQIKANVLAPAEPFFAVGDIHGCADQFDKLLAKIDAGQGEKIVFLGDYVDRGPKSADVIRKLYALTQERPDQIICLQGNHEKMMRDFIDDPLDRGAMWLRNGGVETLASFGITGVPQLPNPDQAIEICDALEAVLPAGFTAWMDDLPLSWHSGNMWCVHAAMDPAVPPRAQRTKTMLWGHPKFLSEVRADDICVIHGHTIFDDPTNANSRIAIDTGAYQTGRLTAARITADHCDFVVVT